MPTWMAEEPVVFVHPNGSRTNGRIAIGLPTQDPENASCPLALDGLDRTISICGETTLQALLLAVRFAGMRLHDFLTRGGRVLDPRTGEDVELDALFGPLLREPAGVDDAPDDDAAVPE